MGCSGIWQIQNFFLIYPRFLHHILNCEIQTLATYPESFQVVSHSKKTFANMRREAKNVLGIVTPLFSTMMGVTTLSDERAAEPAVPHPTPATTQVPPQ